MLKHTHSPRLLSALFVFAAILCLPLAWVAAQSRPDLESQVARDSARLDDLSTRVDSFSNLLTDVAVLKAEVAGATKLLWYLIAGAIAAGFAEIGHRIRSSQKRRETDEALLREIRDLKKG